MDALRQLTAHRAHIAAKQRQARWLKGWQVVMAQVVRCYGDAGIPHPLANGT